MLAENGLVDTVLFLYNTSDEKEVKDIKAELEVNKNNYRIVMYDEIRRNADKWDEIIRKIGVDVLVVFIGNNRLSSDLSEALRNYSKEIPVIVAILKSAKDFPQVPIFLQRSRYIDFYNESSSPYEQLRKEIETHIGGK